MESSQRVKSVSVVVKKGEEGVSIFNILKRCGVNSGEDLMAVQVLPGGTSVTKCYRGKGVKTRTPGMQLHATIRARNLIHFRRQFSRPPFHVKFQFPRPPFGEGRLVLKPLGS